MKLSRTTFNMCSPEAVKHHKEMINSPNAFSLMLTLNNKLKTAPANIQYKNSYNEIRKLFSQYHEFFKEFMATAELDGNTNIHWHIYGTLTDDYKHIREVFKKHLYKNESLGVYHFFTLIKKGLPKEWETLEGYPFKDTERTTQLLDFHKVIPQHHLFHKEAHKNDIVIAPKPFPKADGTLAQYFDYIKHIDTQIAKIIKKTDLII